MLNSIRQSARAARRGPPGRILVLAGALFFPAACGGADAPPAETTSDVAEAVSGAPSWASSNSHVWPNKTSWKISDPWIAKNHDAIREMHPRVLALNFANGRTNDDMNALIGQIFAGLKEGSRYHGYSDPKAKPFLDYVIAKSVDLTDHPAPAGWPYMNSTKYPRKPASTTDYWHFDYGALFNSTFAKYYGFVDPKHASHDFDLCELINRGEVHEIWVYGSADVPDGFQPDVNAAEVLESKQIYDASGARVAGQFDTCAGNGCYDPGDAAIVKACGRTVKIAWVNDTRGPGCLLHSLGHGVEGMARGSVPYLQNNFPHFANFDLDSRLGAPFSSWYACSEPGCVNFTGDNSLTWNVGGQTGAIAKYDQGCGSVHFPPNGRQHYDDVNMQSVLSTCEHFGLKDGPGGADRAEEYTAAKSQQYDALAPDCEGGWQVYWRQSFPGHGNHATGADGKRMHNWWPFLYY
jgi:hypothetical protein